MRTYVKASIVARSAETHLLFDACVRRDVVDAELSTVWGWGRRKAERVWLCVAAVLSNTSTLASQKAILLSCFFCVFFWPPPLSRFAFGPRHG